MREGRWSIRIIGHVGVEKRSSSGGRSSAIQEKERPPVVLYGNGGIESMWSTGEDEIMQWTVNRRDEIKSEGYRFGM